MIAPPPTFQHFLDAHPEVGEAYQALGRAATHAGPLDTRSVHLVKLGLAIGMQHEGAVHAHARKALGAGFSADELRHAAIVAVTTLGFPRMMAAYTWVEDEIAAHTDAARHTPEPS
ncbi:MAG: carboxymuconolactone decarboxylase family protein [Rubricoccaceae bacterium]